MKTRWLTWAALLVLLALDACVLLHRLLPDGYGAYVALFHAASGWVYLLAWPAVAWVAWTDRWWAPLGMPALLYHLLVLLPSGVAHPEPERTVLTANLLFSVPNPEPQLRALLHSGADVLAIQEFTPAVARAVEALGVDYPHRYLDPKKGPPGMAILSRSPQSGLRVSRRWIRVVIDGWVYYSVHTSPPLNIAFTRARVEQLHQLAAEVAAETLPVVVLGDLNIGPTSPDLLAFQQAAGLTDAVRWCGRGWTATWGLQSTPTLIRLDHVLISEELVCASADALPRLGSDHAPLRVRVGHRAGLGP